VAAVPPLLLLLTPVVVCLITASGNGTSVVTALLFALDTLRRGLAFTVSVVGDVVIGSLKLNIRVSPEADTTGGEGIADGAGCVDHAGCGGGAGNVGNAGDAGGAGSTSASPRRWMRSSISFV
jgi:hypothetical protein